MSPAFRVLRSADLPARLLDLEEPPLELYLRGELPRGPAVAVVGTRCPTKHAERFAFELGFRLARAGVAVFSGGAKGIDTAAHQGALAGKGTTVVIAPAGYDHPYPERNRDLFEEVVRSGGAYVSLVADDVPASRPSFFARNRCLAALAHALIVVQAPLRSGARNAAAAARKLGRLAFAVPSPPWVAKGRGCIEELRLGARPLASTREVLRALSEAHLHAVPVPRPRRRRHPTQLSLLEGEDDEGSVLRAVLDGARHPDEICERTGLLAARVQASILTLTLKGALVPAPDGRLRAPTPPLLPGKGVP